MLDPSLALITKPKSHMFGDPREFLGLGVGQNHGVYTNSMEFIHNKVDKNLNITK